MKPLVANRGLLAPAALGLVHAAVDAASGLVLGRWLPDLDPGRLVLWFLVYDACAFALQPLFGALGDRFRRPRALAAAGIALVLAALFIPGGAPWLALVTTGVGNALFHVGGGVMAATATPERAAGPGLFIGPGALGVYLGTLAGDAPAAAIGAPLAGLGAALALGLLLTAALEAGPGVWPPGPTTPAGERHPAGGVRLAATLLLGAIAVRGFVGFAAVTAVTEAPHAALVLAGAAFLGKAVGGLLADRWGWQRTTRVVLPAAALLFAAAPGTLTAVALGVVLFQQVTGVTLAALHALAPRRLGLTFGLACLALLLGSLPFVGGWAQAVPALTSPALIVVLTLAATAAIHRALGALPGLARSPRIADRARPARRRALPPRPGAPAGVTASPAAPPTACAP